MDTNNAVVKDGNELKQPKKGWNIAHEDWRTAPQRLPEIIKKQNPNFKISMLGDKEPGDLGGCSMDVNGKLNLHSQRLSTSQRPPAQVPFNTPHAGGKSGGRATLENATTPALARIRGWGVWCPTYDWASRNLPTNPFDLWWMTGPQISTEDGGPMHRPDFTLSTADDTRNVLSDRYEKYRAQCMGCLCNPLTMLVEENPLASSFESKKKCNSVEWAQRCAVRFRCFCRLNSPGVSNTNMEKFPDLSRGNRARWRRYLSGGRIKNSHHGGRQNLQGGEDQQETMIGVAKLAALASLQMSSVLFTGDGKPPRALASGTNSRLINKIEATNITKDYISPAIFHSAFRYDCSPMGLVHSLMPTFSSPSQGRLDSVGVNPTHASDLSKEALNLYSRELSMCADCRCDPATSAVVARIPSNLSELQEAFDAPELYPDQDHADRCAHWYKCGCFAETKQPLKSPDIPLEEYQRALEQTSTLLKGANPTYRWYYDILNGEWISWGYTQGVDKENMTSFLGMYDSGPETGPETPNKLITLNKREKYGLQSKNPTLSLSELQTKNNELAEPAPGQQEQYLNMAVLPQRNLTVSKELEETSVSTSNSIKPEGRAVDTSVFGHIVVRCPSPDWIETHLLGGPAGYATFLTSPKTRPPIKVMRSTRDRSGKYFYVVMKVCKMCLCDQTNGSMGYRLGLVGDPRFLCNSADWPIRCSNWFRCSCTAVMKHPDRDQTIPIQDYYQTLARLASTHRQKNPLYKWEYDKPNGKYLIWDGFGQEEKHWEVPNDDNLPVIDWDAVEGGHRQMMGDRYENYLEGPDPPGGVAEWGWNRMLDVAEGLAAEVVAAHRVLPHNRGRRRLLGPPRGNGRAIQKRGDDVNSPERAAVCAIEDWEAGDCIREDMEDIQRTRKR